MFGKRIMFYECKDFLMTNCVRLKPVVEIDSNTYLKIKFTNGKRNLFITLHKGRGSVIVDITDDYYMLRIPQEEFKNVEKYQAYILGMLKKVDYTLN